MGGIRCFEDIQAWQKARELAAMVYQVTGRGAFARDFGLKDQIRRAAVSIMSNIAEGFERNGNREFQQFLAIAKGSVGEVKAQLYVALDASLIDQPMFQRLYTCAQEVASLIAGLIRYLKRSPLRGSKYRPTPNHDVKP